VTSNRLAVAQTNLESTGKKNEEVFDDKKVVTVADQNQGLFFILKVAVTWREIDCEQSLFCSKIRGEERKEESNTSERLRACERNMQRRESQVA